jgi:alkylation response protein AidB-like acyl-CoA dehydrogenase
MPHAEEFDRREELPRSVIDELGKNRFLGATFPEEFGGLDMDPVSHGYLLEIIGKACGSSRSLLTVQVALLGEALLRFGTDEQKKKWLPALAEGRAVGAFGLTEPDVGSDARSVETSYEAVPGGYRINGKKRWTSFAEIADIFLIICSRGEGKEHSAFLVERDRKGLSTKPMKGLMAMRACHIAEVTLDGVEIPKENMLGPEGRGFDFVANAALDHGRYSIAWGGLSIAAAGLDAMATYARTREQFGRKLGEFQLIRKHVANAVTLYEAGRSLCIEAGRLRENLSSAALMRTMMAKYFCSKIALDIASDAVQVHGGNGFSPNFPVGRLFRDAKVMQVIEGASEMQEIVIGKHGIRAYGRSP